jgi:hypothetical protein
MMASRRNWLLVLLACLSLLAAGSAGACGGGGDDDDGGNGGAQTSAPATNGDDGGDDGGDGGDALDGLTFQINETFYHSGFEVELGEGSVQAVKDTFGNIDGYVLTIEGTFKNLGGSQSSFAPEMTVVQGTRNYTKNFGSRAPTVGSGLTGEGDLLFNIDEEFDYEQARLVIGEGDETRAEVPFAPAAGALVALAPEEITLSGTISLALIDLTFTGAELRYDVPERWETVEDGDRALTLHFGATSRKTGNWNIFAQEFSLTKPNGNSVPVSGSKLGSLPGSTDGTTTEDLYLRFIVDADAEGDYSLRYKPAGYWVEGGPAEGTLEFTIN